MSVLRQKALNEFAKKVDKENWRDLIDTAEANCNFQFDWEDVELAVSETLRVVQELCEQKANESDNEAMQAAADCNDHLSQFELGKSEAFRWLAKQTKEEKK